MVLQGNLFRGVEWCNAVGCVGKARDANVFFPNGVWSSPRLPWVIGRSGGGRWNISGLEESQSPQEMASKEHDKLLHLKGTYGVIPFECVGAATQPYVRHRNP